LQIQVEGDKKIVADESKRCMCDCGFMSEENDNKKRDWSKRRSPGREKERMCKQTNKQLVSSSTQRGA